MKRIASAESGMTALFVRRPVLAFVLNTLIAVAGLAALYAVEVRELPDVDRPVITVTTTYTGASAETIDREITSEIEGAVARVSGVKSISSTSTHAFPLYPNSLHTTLGSPSFEDRSRLPFSAA